MSYHFNSSSNYYGNYTFRNMSPNFQQSPPFYQNPSPNFIETCDNFTPHFVHPPQLAPEYMLPKFDAYLSDKDIANQFTLKIKQTSKTKQRTHSISDIKVKLSILLEHLNTLKKKEEFMSENITTLSETKWNSLLKETENGKTSIDKVMAEIGPCLDLLRKLLAKRLSKRVRLKKLKLDNKKRKEDWIKDKEEKSRKIDENLQKIQNDILKIKQEEESQINADIVLKDVMHKKTYAKKCINKLEALLKLRKARASTARGRGKLISEPLTAAFEQKIDNLKNLWLNKFSTYEKEELIMKAKLHSKDKPIIFDNSLEITKRNLSTWKDFLFGKSKRFPQEDFKGDINKFVDIRSQWDQYVDSDGTSLPVGWVTPM